MKCDNCIHRIVCNKEEFDYFGDCEHFLSKAYFEQSGIELIDNFKVVNYQVSLEVSEPLGSGSDCIKHKEFKSYHDAIAEFSKSNYNQFICKIIDNTHNQPKTRYLTKDDEDKFVYSDWWADFVFLPNENVFYCIRT